MRNNYLSIDEEMIASPALDILGSMKDDIRFLKELSLSPQEQGSGKRYTCTDKSLTEKMKAVNLFTYACLVWQDGLSGRLFLESRLNENKPEPDSKDSHLNIDPSVKLFLAQAGFNGIKDSMTAPEIKKILQSTATEIKKEAA